MIISAQKLFEVANKWQKIGVSKRKRITYKHSTSAASKGHFVVYSMDKKRFEVPLRYISNNVVKELLKLSEEEFGLSPNGPITLPCDGVFLDYIFLLIRAQLPKHLEEALISFVANCHIAASSSGGLSEEDHHQPIIYGF